MKKNCCKSSIKGFTLIELLVVVLIIGILAAIALPQYQKAVERARTADALARINAIEKAIELVVLQNGGIPEGNLVGIPNSSLSALQSDIELTNGLSCDTYCYNKNWEFIAFCRNGACDWQADRCMAKEDPDICNMLTEVFGSFDGETWSRQCYYETDLGEQICNTLNSSLNFDVMEEGF